MQAHRGACLGLALAARQVDQVEAADADVRLGVGAQLAALHGDDEDGVRARAVLVHVRRAAQRRPLDAHARPHARPHSPDRPVLVADAHHVLDLLHALRHERRQLLHVHADIGPLLQLQHLGPVLGQQVLDVLLHRSRKVALDWTSQTVPSIARTW